MIRLISSKDLSAVTAIYQQGMDTGIATFETEAPKPEEWDRKFHPMLRYVYVSRNEILGWTSLSPFSSRPAYQGVGEVSVYMKAGCEGKGIGTALLRHLEQEAGKQGYWMLQSSIFEVNRASIHLHKICGFRLVGVREKIAMRDGVWHNTVLMEKRLSIPDEI